MNSSPSIHTTQVNPSFINDCFLTLSKLFGNSFSNYLSVKWKPPTFNPIHSSKKVLYASAIYIPIMKQCFVFFHIGWVSRINYNPTNQESFSKLITEISHFYTKTFGLSYHFVIILFPSLSFISSRQQKFTLYKLHSQFKDKASYFFKSSDQSLDCKNYSISRLSFPISESTNIIFVGLFQFFSCKTFLDISHHHLSKRLSDKYSSLSSYSKKTIFPLSSILSFLYTFKTFIKCLTKEFHKNFEINHIFLANSLFQYSFTYFLKISQKKKKNFWAFSHFPSYCLIQNVSQSGLLIVNSIGNHPSLFSFPSFSSIPEKFQKWSKGPFYHYDVNSLYPYIMANYPLPTGQPKIFTMNRKSENPKVFFENEFKNFFGFLEVEITLKSLSPLSENFDFTHSTLPYRFFPSSKSSKTVFPVGTFYGIYFYSEILHLMNMELIEKITIFRAIKYKKTIIFDTLMNYAYQLRDSKVSPYTHQSMKFIMNSFYGNLSINPFKLSKLISDNPYNSLQFMYPKFHFMHKNIGSYTDISIDSSLYRIVRTQRFPPYSFNENLQSYLMQNFVSNSMDEFHDFIQTQLPHVSAAIASYGRIFLSKIIFDNRLPIILCNTDSFITNKPLPPHLVCFHTMGKFKLIEEYNTIFVKSLNQYIVQLKKNNQYRIVGNFSNKESYIYSNPDTYIQDMIPIIFRKNSSYISKELGRTPILDKNNIPFNWTGPFQIYPKMGS